MSYAKLEKEIKKLIAGVKANRIHGVIKENNIKSDSTYSAYNFRNKDQEDEYRKAGYTPKATVSLYNQKAVDFIFKVINNENKP